MRKIYLITKMRQSIEDDVVVLAQRGAQQGKKERDLKIMQK